jgi:hypothetical protein
MTITSVAVPANNATPSAARDLRGRHRGQASMAMDVAATAGLAANSARTIGPRWAADCRRYPVLIALLRVDDARFVAIPHD